MPNKSITIITPTYYPHTGGVETVALKEREVLEGLSWNIKVVTSDQGLRNKDTIKKSKRYKKAMFY